MASLRDIRTRIASVQNTQQITRAMKMVAAAKLRRAQEQIFQTRPYAFKIREMIGHIREFVDPTSHPLFQPREAAATVLVVVVTSDRGLAGAFNANVLKSAEAAITEQYDALRGTPNLKIMAVGRKGHDYFRKRGFTLVGDYRGFFNDLAFGRTDAIADRVVAGWIDGEWDEVVVVYNEFKNTIAQNRIVEPFLPIPTTTFSTPVMEEDAGYRGPVTDHKGDVDYIFEPSAEAILEKLIPQYLSYQLWRIVLESNAAEQGARMVAMDNATSNAGELLDQLRLTYNRARQAAITTEIIEISSGAEALQQA
ncbi:MAG: ATP synthase F1 subunit gamma [Rhodothermales bacterium]